MDILDTARVIIQSHPHWLNAAVGGAMIGLSAALYLLLNGRVAGISGLTANAVGIADTAPRAPSLLFVLALIAGALLASLWWREPQVVITAPTPLLIIGGLLVGYGTRLGGGCTSGHGVCGMARLSLRSIVATLAFMAVAAATVYVMRHAFIGAA